MGAGRKPKGGLGQRGRPLWYLGIHSLLLAMDSQARGPRVKLHVSLARGKWSRNMVNNTSFGVTWTASLLLIVQP